MQTACAHGEVYKFRGDEYCYKCGIDRLSLALAKSEKALIAAEQKAEYAWKNVRSIEQHRVRVEEICDKGIKQREAVIGVLRSIIGCKA